MPLRLPFHSKCHSPFNGLLCLYQCCSSLLLIPQLSSGFTGPVVSWTYQPLWPHWPCTCSLCFSYYPWGPLCNFLLVFVHLLQPSCLILQPPSPLHNLPSFIFLHSTYYHMAYWVFWFSISPHPWECKHHERISVQLTAVFSVPHSQWVLNIYLYTCLVPCPSYHGQFTDLPLPADWARPKSRDHISLVQLLLQHLGRCHFAKIPSKCGEWRSELFHFTSLNLYGPATPLCLKHTPC